MRKLVAVATGLLSIVAGACAGDGDDRSSAPELPTIPARITSHVLPTDFSFTPLPSDERGRWVRITIEGVSVEVPTGRPWRSVVWVDPCFDDLRRAYLLQNDATGYRLKIDMADKTVTADFAGPPRRLDWLIDCIQRSFSGERKIPPEVEAVLPVPIDSCDPAVAVPTLHPEPTPWPTVPPEPTWTPVRTTEGTEVASSPQPSDYVPQSPE